MQNKKGGKRILSRSPFTPKIILSRLIYELIMGEYHFCFFFFPRQHWQIPLSKRFRALKLWFVIRKYGIKGLQKHVREVSSYKCEMVTAQSVSKHCKLHTYFFSLQSVRLAQKFEALVLADQRFEIPAQRHLGLVVFRLRGDNDLTEKLLKRLNARGKLHCVPAAFKVITIWD